MKKLGLIVAAALIASPAIADNHKMNVDGEIFANMSMNQKLNKEMGFNVNRARLGINGMINDTWMARVVLDAGTSATSASSATSVKKAYIKGKNVFTDGDHLRFGVGANIWKDVLDPVLDNRWIEASAVDTLNYVNDYQSGVRYGNLSNAFAYSVALHSGSEAGTTNGVANEATGIEVYLAYNFNKMMGLHVMLNNNAEGKDGTASAKADTTAVAFHYKTDMITAVLENAQTKVATADARTAMKLTVGYDYSDKAGVHVSMQNHNKDEEASSSLKSRTIVGHKWNLAKGLRTGLFYTMDANTASAADQNVLSWNWNATF